MTNSPPSAGNDDVQAQRDIDEIFSRANPNPDRVGCPPRDDLIALAARRRPIDDPGYEHLGKCSPCYREFRALQAQLPVTSSGMATWWRAAIAAALLVAIGGAWWLTTQRADSRAAVASRDVGAPVARAELDLRPFVVTRSEKAAADAEPVRLPASAVDLTLLLPTGAEPGLYDVQLLDADLQSRAETTGTAAIENFVTTLRVSLDLGALTTGGYQLAVRRQGDSWRMYPARVE